ncbi:alanine--tRNA ligase, partial [bacterium]|nr:alanine--tRNA ligase [bacterium]
KDNFWEMGETGPCGPCSEIHIDRGEGTCDKPPGHACGVNSGCARYMEIWNLVFIQNNREPDGRLSDLPARHVDTGMGLERVTSIIQGVDGTYDTDLLRPMISVAERRSGRRYGATMNEQDVAFRVIADHGRAVAVMIGDGLLPSNEGRGYVLRRLLRRAARQGRVLGLVEPFLGEVTDAVCEVLGSGYPDLAAARERIRAAVTAEEERFGETLEKGLGLLEEEVARLRAGGGATLPGEVAFKLYDTYGFPFDLTEDILRDRGLAVEQAGFDAAMEAQRKRAREGARFATATAGAFAEAASRFAGDRVGRLESEIVGLAVDGEEREIATEGQEVEIVTAETPFYGESGGQVGDRGRIALADGTLVEVVDTQRPRAGLVVHRGRVVKGAVVRGRPAILEIDAALREATRLNHSATHILHAALRRQVGSQVRQAGSMVSPERLRFDFAHDARLSEERLAEIEDEVNARIRENAEVSAEEMAYDDAIRAGALAFFGDKYGDRVRVLRMGDFSVELCGGTHVARTGDIGVFKLRSESAVGAGVRRIEAFTGTGALDAIRRRERELRGVAEMLRGSEDEVAAKIEKLLAAQRDLEKKLADSQSRLAADASKDLLEGVREVAGVRVLAKQVPGIDAGALRELSDKLRDRMKSGVVVLGGAEGDKVLLLAAVTKDLVGRVNAGAIVKEIAPIVGGKGGGRPDFAQAGGSDASRLPQALERVFELIA